MKPYAIEKPKVGNSKLPENENKRFVAAVFWLNKVFMNFHCYGRVDDFVISLFSSAIARCCYCRQTFLNLFWNRQILELHTSNELFNKRVFISLLFHYLTYYRSSSLKLIAKGILKNNSMRIFLSQTTARLSSWKFVIFNWPM